MFKQELAFAVTVYVTVPMLILMFKRVCGGMFPFPFGVLPLIPAAAVDVQEKFVPVTLDEIGIEFVEFPLQIEVSAGRIMLGVGFTVML